MKKYIIGIFIGVLLTVGTTVFAEQVKQYILTEVSYPIIVNGIEYKDAERPILSYEGNTYVPLAKLGDLTGVNYKWNSELNRVEINTNNHSSAIAESSVENYTFDERGNLRNAEGILAEEENIRKFQNENKVVVDNQTGLKVIGKNQDGTDIIALQVYNNEGKLIGTYTDEDDSNLVIAIVKRTGVLPPKLSDGWISGKLVQKIYNIDIAYEGSNLIFKTSPFDIEQKEFLRLSLPANWKDSETGSTTAEGVKLQKYNGEDYFDIAGLMKVGIIK